MAKNSKATVYNGKKLSNKNIMDVYANLFDISKSGKVFNNIMCLIKKEENIVEAYNSLHNSSNSYIYDIDGCNIRSLHVLSINEVIKKVQNKLNCYHQRASLVSSFAKQDGILVPSSIPTVIDRVCQQAILQIIEPICEGKFSAHSYGHRKGYRPENALSEVYGKMQLANCHYVVDLYFDNIMKNISHAKLKQQLWTIGIRDKTVLSVISEVLNGPIRYPNGIWEKPNVGIVQCGVLMNLFLNVSLNEFDSWIDSQWRSMKTRHNYTYVTKEGRITDKNKYTALRGTKKNPCHLKEMYFVRFDDSVKIFCKEKRVADLVLIASRMWIQERLRIKLDDNKTRVIDTKNKYIDFLGFRIKLIKKKNKYVISSHVCDYAISKIKKNLKAQIYNIKHPRPTNNIHVEIMLFNEQVIKIHRYYSMATCVNSDLRKPGNDCRYLIERLGCRKVNEDEHLPKSLKAYNEYINQVRVLSGNLVLPLLGTKFHHPMGKSRQTTQNPYRNDSAFYDIYRRLLREARYSWTSEYHLNRASTWVLQEGKCDVMGIQLQYEDINCHHIIPREKGGTDDLQNLVILHKDIHLLIHSSNHLEIQEIIGKYKNLSRSQKDKINKYRKSVGLETI